MPLQVYTAQRDAYRGRDALDLTHAGTFSHAFVGAGTHACTATRASVATARQRYLAFLRTSYRAYGATWATLLNRSRVVLLCSCPPGSLACRRYVLAEALSKLGATLHGEIRSTLTVRPQRVPSFPRRFTR